MNLLRKLTRKRKRDEDDDINPHKGKKRKTERSKSIEEERNENNVFLELVMKKMDSIEKNIEKVGKNVKENKMVMEKYEKRASEVVGELKITTESSNVEVIEKFLQLDKKVSTTSTNIEMLLKGQTEMKNNQSTIEERQIEILQNQTEMKDEFEDQRTKLDEIIIITKEIQTQISSGWSVLWKAIRGGGVSAIVTYGILTIGFGMPYTSAVSIGLSAGVGASTALLILIKKIRGEIRKFLEV